MFTITDKDVEARASTTWLRCDECGGVTVVHDQPDNEQAMDEAANRHECPLMCCACGEPLDAEDRAFNVLACTPCRLDDPEGTQEAVTKHIESMTVAQMRVYLSRLPRLAS